MNQPHGGSAFPNLLIRASAGTGKTFQLSNRFITLLRRQQRCSQILATTFTRKAAGEIQDRVVLRLAEAATDPDRRSELGQHAGGEPLTQEAAVSLLGDTLHQLHRLRISTLDSFFAQIARSFALELGFAPAWQIVDEVVDMRLRSQAIDAVLANGEPRQLETLFNLLTKGEATRGVHELIRETVNSLYQVFLDTGPEAWTQVPQAKPLESAELEEVLENLRTLELSDKRMLKCRDQEYDLAVAGQWDTLLGKGLAAKVRAGADQYYRKPIPPDVVSVYQRLIGHIRGELVGRVAMQTQATYQLLALFDVEYRRLKSRLGALRFEDVTRRLSDAGAAYAVEHLAFRLDAQIEHLLLDEFQDTSPQQWTVLEPFAQRVAAPDAAECSFFCVGDAKQAIYGWRGGVAEIFDAIDQQLEGLQPQSLNTSYRSSQPVIETVNQTFSRMTQHPALGRAERATQRWQDQFPLHQTARQDLAGYTELVAAPRAGELQNQREVTLGYTAERVAEIVSAAPGMSVGILVRKNDTVARLIHLLRGLQVAASEEGGNSLTNSAAVNVIVSAMRLADHPGDSVARFHLAKSPLGPHLDLCDFTDQVQANKVSARLREQLVTGGYGPTVYAWAEQLAGSCSARELNRLNQLVKMAYAYGNSATLRADDFIAHVTVTRVADPAPADVRVMTIHQAKGLEFDVVVLPELDVNLVGQPDMLVVDRPDPAGPVRRVCRYANQAIQDLLPKSWQEIFAQADDRAVTESLCVLYVALTRAIHGLHMIVPPSSANEKQPPNKLSGLLRAALTDGGPAEPEEVLYQHGVTRWYRHPNGDSRDVVSTGGGRESGSADPIVVRLPAPPQSPHRGWERARPSGLEGGSRIPIGQVLRGGTSDAFLRGQILHAWFEQIHWLDDDPVPTQRLDTIAEEIVRREAARNVDVSQLHHQFQQMLERPEVTSVLRSSRYAAPERLGFAEPIHDRVRGAIASVQNERGFAFRDGQQLLTGFIDRLVILRVDGQPVAADIIDFKTDVLQADDSRQVEQRAEFYAPQLAAYRRAVADALGLDPAAVLTHLLFVGPGILRRV